MVVCICAWCGKRMPDSFHDWDDECMCVDHKKHAKDMKWMIKSKGKVYDFSKK